MAGDKRRNRASIRLAADIGGTFTDIAVFDEASGQLTFDVELLKVLSPEVPDMVYKHLASDVDGFLDGGECFRVR